MISHNDYTLNNFDIDKIMKNDKNFRGVFMKDTLPLQINKNESSIINLDTIKGPGTHWVLVYNTQNDPYYVYYIDSYGLSPLKEISDYLKSSHKKIRYNTSQIQGLFDTYCGYFACLIALELNKGTSLYDILYKFSQEPIINNSKIIEKYFHLN